MSKLTFILILIALIMLSTVFLMWLIKLFFKGLLFLMMHPLQTLLLLVCFWIATLIIKNIIKTII